MSDRSAKRLWRPTVGIGPLRSGHAFKLEEATFTICVGLADLQARFVSSRPADPGDHMSAGAKTEKSMNPKILPVIMCGGSGHPHVARIAGELAQAVHSPDRQAFDLSTRRALVATDIDIGLGDAKLLPSSVKFLYIIVVVFRFREKQKFKKLLGRVFPFELFRLCQTGID